MKSILAVIIVLCWSVVHAQPYQPYLNIPVTQNGNLIRNPWAGGFDAAEFQPIDLNGDGIKDLFTFEKGGDAQTYHRYTTLLNMGTAGQVDYVDSPQYKKCFPLFLHDWILLEDYDCDGREDIFAYELNGTIKVYHNDFDALGLHFHLAYDTLHSDYFGLYAPLGVLPTNQPSLADVDNDGDLDILTFSNSGNNVEYHQNLAEENFGRCDTLVFTLVTQCWGNFGLSGFSNKAILNLSCRPYPGYTLPLDKEQSVSLHSGSCAIAPDLDGDGDKDFLNGDILGNTLLYIENGGNDLSANMVSQDTLFPAYDTSIDFRTFPASYYFDADNDGNKDMIVTPCIPNASRNYNNVLFYKNTTDNATNVFHYIKDDLFVEDMIDVGSGANVAVADVDGDGLRDMVIGNYNYVNQQPPSVSSVAYYKNIGTSLQPSYNLITTDFANMSSLGLYGIFPTFGDLDADGDSDMIIGTEDGFLDYFQNTGSGNFNLLQVHMTASNSNPINIGSYAAPLLVDLNRDGKLDLVIGEKSGNLNYYENTGTTTNASFTFVTNILGNVSVIRQGMGTTSSIYGYSSPYFYDNGGTWQLFVGSLSGYIYRYDDIENNIGPGETFNLVDSSFLYEPIRATISGTDINNDGLVDFLIGNNAGGTTWYSNSTTAVNEITSVPDFFNLYPNPLKDILYVEFDKESKYTRHQIILTDILGRKLFRLNAISNKATIDVSSFANGMYICKVTQNGETAIKKFIIQR